MIRIHLEEPEVREIEALLAEVCARYKSAEDPHFLNSAAVIAHSLPRRVREMLLEFKLLEPTHGLCLLSGIPVDEEEIGLTPKHWKARADVSPALRNEILLVLFGSLLGDLLGWSTQQDGYIVHDILPIPEHQGEQLGTGSEELLWWHSEDAFHPFRGDYLALACLRNLDSVATTVGHLDVTKLDPEHVTTLFEPRFVILPDESHTPQHRGSPSSLEADGISAAYEKIARMRRAPQKVAVLYGHPESPYLRLDPYFMGPLDHDPPAKCALEALTSMIEAGLRDVVLQPGEYLFIDNYRAVHGRRPFRARFDGRDRWLKRINIARDLRKSREARAGSSSRVLV